MHLGAKGSEGDIPALMGHSGTRIEAEMEIFRPRMRRDGQSDGGASRNFVTIHAARRSTRS